MSEVNSGVARLSETDIARKRLELILRSSRLGTWDWNMQTGETTFNDRWAEIIGYTLAELEPTTIDTWAEHAHPEDLIESNDLVMRHIQGLDPYYEITVRMRHKDGRWVWVRDRGMIVEREPDGQPIRMVGTHTDVTDEAEAARIVAESQRRFAAMFRDHDAVMLLIDPASGQIVDANPAAADFYGYSMDVLTSMRIDQINMLQPAEVARRRAQALTGHRGRFVFPHKLASGEIRKVEVHSSPLEDDGRLLLFSIVTDITELEAREERLREAAAVFDNISDAVLLSDEHAIVRQVNAAFPEVTGWQSEDIVGRSMREVAGRLSDSLTADAVREALRAEVAARVGISLRRADGTFVPVLVTVSPVRGAHDQITGYVTLISDIADRVRTERAQLDRVASYDALTGLPNRSRFTELLATEIERLRQAEQGAVLMFVDIDRFKDVNDSYGHDTGDVLLTTITERLRSYVGPGDLLARFGGNEFAIVFNQVSDAERALDLARDVQAVLAPPCPITDDAEVFVTACVGMILLGESDLDALDSLQAGASALHEAKTAGPGSIREHQFALMVESRARLSMETRLRHGWDNHELFLRYQPQIDAQSDGIIGAEALLAWTTADGERIGPDEFIPVAERMGLIGDIGSWVLQQACLQGTAWDQEGLPPLTMSVNVSAKQLLDGRLPGDVAAALRDTEFPADRLRLELTESALLSTGSSTFELLEALRSQGVQLSIDDFGTGYSSFAYLRRFPLSEIKVDRSFVMDLESSADDRAICSSILALGHGLGLRVVAEGVETNAQLAFIRSHGCDLYQGYLFSPAVDPRAFADLVRTGL